VKARSRRIVATNLTLKLLLNPIKIIRASRKLLKLITKKKRWQITRALALLQMRTTPTPTWQSSSALP